MPESSIDITSPGAGTTQPYTFVASVDYDNQSGTNVWVRVTCSFDSGGGSHTVTTASSVPAGSGTFDATFPHTSGQTGVTVSARLTELSSGLGTLYAAASIGNVTISQTPAITVTPTTLPSPTPESVLDPDSKAEGSKLRITSKADQDLVLEGTYDKTKGTEVAVVVVGGKKKRPQVIYETKDGEVVLDAAAGTWKATVPKKALQGHKRRGAVAILYDANRNYVDSTSTGLKE